ncbi:MAG: hypothetical protein JRN68_06945 [Nitrososphaerota archaeon]|nr:hypothetical protein [Nitrososphaerota archaeon]
MSKHRPPYPIEYYQALRKEANFGCAKCGVPIVTIHHIEGYEGEHHLRELIMLCKEHHSQADQGLITKEELYVLKTNPFNEASVKHKLQVSPAKDIVVHIGGNTFVETPVPLQLHGEPIISVRREGSEVLFSLTLYGKDGDTRVKMVDNVWEADASLVDVRYSEDTGNADVWLSIKLEDSEPYIEVRVIDGELHLKGRFYLRGNLLDVRDDGSFVLNQQMYFRGITAIKCGVGIAI